MEIENKNKEIFNRSIENMKKVFKSQDENSQTCIFGYGSLIWKIDFEFEMSINGFNQGSPDHRGTMQNPGRVCTLEENQGATTFGMLYQLRHRDKYQVLDKLAVREQSGYECRNVIITCIDNVKRPALIFIATSLNPFYIFNESLSETASVIAYSKGQSGENFEYFAKLLKSYRLHKVHNAYLEEIFSQILSLEPSYQSLFDSYSI